MEAVEETAAPPVGLNNNNNDLTPIAKGKRTKRHRTHSPTAFTTCRPPSVPVVLANNQHVPTSPASASSSAGNSTTTEEEDTARCLILLAQGHFPSNNRITHDHHHYRQASDKKMMFSQNTGNTSTTKLAGGASIYTCKTCSRSFSSFQALGGHRASHKKPKYEKRSAFFSDEEDFPSPSSVSSFKNRIPSNNSLSLQLNISNFSPLPKSAAPSPRIHECSYCGAEFNSGQALGGHMRRHRGGPNSPSVIPTSAAASPRNVLSLDLNLPAPEDENPRFGVSGQRPQSKRPEERQSNDHQGAAGERVDVLPSSTSPPSMVVDCHD